jgi:hypothetical protein
MKVTCNKCQATLTWNPEQTVGCLCDSDAPTWICITRTKQFVHMSHADYTIKEK